MASFAAKIIGKKILGETLENKFGKEVSFDRSRCECLNSAAQIADTSQDPYFEQIPATRLDGRPTGKTKKRRKALPPGLSEHDSQILTKVKRRAYRLDMALFSFMGIRFGWGSAIGLVPA